MPVRPHTDEEIQDAEAVEGVPEALVDVRAFMKDKLGAPEVEKGLEFSLSFASRNKIKGEATEEISGCFVQIGDDVEDFAQNMTGDAEKAARDYIGKTRFVVRAVGMRGSCGFTLKRLGGEEEDEEQDAEVEGLEMPTFRGMANQSMRHAEGMYREARYYMRDGRQNTVDLRQDNRELREENRTLRAKVDEYGREIEAVRNMDHARKIDYATWQKSQERLDGVAEAFGNHVLPLLGQHLIPKLLGGSSEGAAQGGQQAPKQPPAMQALKPEVRTPIEKAAEHLVLSIDQDQVTALRKVLTSDQMDALVAMHHMILERKEREKAARSQYASDVARRAAEKAAPKAPESGTAPNTSLSKIPPGQAGRSAYARTGT